MPIVSKKSEMSRVKISRHTVTNPAFSHEPSRLNSPSRPRSGTATTSSGTAGTFRFHPTGLTVAGSTNVGPTSATASTTIATTVVTRIEIRIAPGTRSE